MKITKEFLKSLTPHQNCWRNYLKHYPEWSGSFAEFLALEKVPTKDKMWLISKNIKDSRFEKFQREFALACACRAVDNCEITEVQELYLISALIVETGDFEAGDITHQRRARAVIDDAPAGGDDLGAQPAPVSLHAVACALHEL